MCGIYGWDLSRINVEIEKKAMLAAILAVGNDGRGGDAHGFWTPSYVLKGLGEIAHIASKTVKEDMIMAHTRKGTCGKNTVENAHPFDVGNVILAHNGILTNHYELNKKYDRNCEVDSMHLAYHMNEGRSLKDICGYGAIEWIQKDRPGRIYLCKLGGGELSIMGIGKDTKECHGIVWSSNEDHAKAALNSANLEHFAFKVETGKVYYIEKGMLYLDDEDRELELSRMGANNFPDWRHGYAAWQQRGQEDDDDITREMLKHLETEEGVEWGDDEEIDENSNEVPEHMYRHIWQDEELKRRQMMNPSRDKNVVDSNYEEEYDGNGGWIKVGQDGTMTRIKEG